MPNSRLLIADDEPDIADIVSAVAEDLGYEVTYIQEGSQVASRVEVLDPAVIVLDLRMPGTDGVQILSELAERGCTARIVLMSGMDQRTINSVESLGKEKRLDIVGALNKPMHPDDIESMLSPLLNAQPTVSKATEDVALTQNSIYGPSVFFSPQKPIREDASIQRAALELVWQFDDGSVLGGEDLFQWTLEQKISKCALSIVLREALQQWKALGDNNASLQLVLPLHPALLEDSTIFSLISETAQHYQFPQHNLIVETSESGIYNSDSTAIECLSRLRIAGFQTAFITQSNADDLLTMIDKLPLDEIVVDMSFLSDDASLSSNMELEFTYSSLTSLAHRKQIDTSARGVVTSDIAAFVERCRFHWAEGTQLAQRVPIGELVSFYSQTNN